MYFGQTEFLVTINGLDILWLERLMDLSIRIWLVFSMRSVKFLVTFTKKFFSSKSYANLIK